MKIVKKIITKEDGRELTYYHFLDSASESQQRAFESVDATEIALNSREVSSANTRTIHTLGDANV